MKPVYLLFWILSFQFQTYGDTGLSQPKVKWRFKTQGPIRAAAVLSGECIYFGSSDSYLYALNKQDGSLLWKFQTAGVITGSPALSDLSVYISSRDNYIYCIDAITGKETWKFAMEPILPASYGSWEYFAAAPIVSGKQVLVASGDGHLYALEKRSGNLLWKFKTSRRISATPLIEDGVIYQPSNDGYVYALDQNTGRLLWKFETRGASYDSKNFGFDRNSIFTQPLIRDGLLVFGSRDGNVYAIDLKTQKEKWHFTYGTTWAMTCSISDNMVFVGWSTNNLTCALDLKTGQEKWKFACGAHVYTKPLVVDSGVYVGSADGNVYKLNKYTGEKYWDYSIGQEIYSSPLYDSGTLFLGSDDGFYYALEDGYEPYKAIYLPSTIEGNTKYLVVDPQLAPYLAERGFVQLDSAELFQFVKDRIDDQKPSVIVFGLPVIPKNIIGESPDAGLMRHYLEAGGKLVWMGDAPNYYEPDDSGNFRRDATRGAQLLGVQYINPTESGNYYSTATQEGLNQGLPPWLKTTAAIVASESVVPLAYDEYGRISVWMKKYHPRAGSGFVSCRTWSWNVPIKQEDLGLIHKLAVYGLE